MRWRTVKVAAGAAIAALFVYGGTVQAADTAVPAPGQSKKIDEIKKRGTLLAAAIGEFPWLPENTSGSGPKFSGPAWVLANEIADHLGVKLEKGAQKANWALRPLTERMAKYARNDTRFLKPLADRLRAELVACGRLSWHQESCARLIADAAKQRPDNLDGIWRVKGSHLLGRPALAILRELWHWREAEAINANRPPFFVLSHENLTHIAAAGAGPRPIEPFLPKHFSQRRREGVGQAIARGLSIASEDQPKPLRSKGRRVSEGERRRHQELQRRRDTRATGLGIDPTLIASRATLASLAYDWDRAQGELMTWQRQLLPCF